MGRPTRNSADGRRGRAAAGLFAINRVGIVESMEKEREVVALGAVIGWRRFPTSNGAVVRVQTATSIEQAHRGEAAEHDLALNALLLRALGEDLIKAADEHEGREHAHVKRWWMF